MSVENSERLGVDFVGFGDHCNASHAPFVGPSSLFEVTGVVDRDEARREQGREMFNLPEEATASTYTELLERSSGRAAIITTPDKTHLTLAREALYNGRSVLVEKPAAGTVEECAELPGLLDYAEQKGLKYWVCHPREFDKKGPWYVAAKLFGNPALVEQTFGVSSPIGKLQEIRYDCFYTLPSGGKADPHASFADDKMNHTVVSALQALPDVAGFSDAIFLDNPSTKDDVYRYDAYMKTIPGKEEEPITVKMSGRRTAHRENHPEGVYRDWAEAIYEEGILRVEPTYGTIALTYGKDPLQPLTFNPERLYDGMFTAINDEFARCVLDPSRPELLSRRDKLLGTAAALLMQQPNFDGMITEEAVLRLSA